MTFLNKAFFYLTIILRPTYWLMNNPYSKEWDVKLNQLMNDYEFIITSYYTAKIGNYTVWIQNHPYASFTPYESSIRYIRPSRYTIYKAMKKIKKMEEKEKAIEINKFLNK